MAAAATSNDLSSDFLGDVLGFTEHAERAFFDLLEEHFGYIGGPIVQAWIDMDKKGIVPVFADPQVLEVWLADDDEDVKESVAEAMADMKFVKVRRDSENLYRARTKKRTALHINYGTPPSGTMVIGPIAGSSYEYAFAEV